VNWNVKQENCNSCLEMLVYYSIGGGCGQKYAFESDYNLHWKVYLRYLQDCQLNYNEISHININNFFTKALSKLVTNMIIIQHLKTVEKQILVPYLYLCCWPCWILRMRAGQLEGEAIKSRCYK